MGLHDRDYMQDPAGRSPSRVDRSGLGSRTLSGSRGRGLSVVMWLIIANVVVFLIQAAPGLPRHDVIIGEARAGDQIVAVTASTDIISEFGRFSTAMVFWWLQPLENGGRELRFELQVWRLVTFQFLHADIWHLTMNMVGLWIFGREVETRLGRRKFLAFYLTGGIAGGLLYLALNLAGNVFGLGIPGVLPQSLHTPLIGASAGVFAVIMAAARNDPTARILAFFVIPMSLRTFAFAFVGIAAFTLLFRNHDPGSNAGGQAAHLGGAIAGWFLFRHHRLLDDFFDIMNRSDKPSAAAKRSARAAGREHSPVDALAAAGISRIDVDRVLARHRRVGLEGLTAAERDLLQRATRALHRPEAP